MIFGINTTSDISKLLYVISPAVSAQYLHLCTGRCLKWYHCSHFSSVSHASYIVGSQTIFYFASGLASIQQICVYCLCFLVKESKSKWKLTSGSDGRNERFHQGRVVRSWGKITLGESEIWTQIWEIKKQIKFNSLCLQFDNWIH